MNSAEGGGRGHTHVWKACKSSCQSERKPERRKWSGEIISVGYPVCALERWPCTQISGRQGDILRSWSMQERCHPFLHHNSFSTFKSPVMLVLNVCFCNFLQMRSYNLFERHTRKRGRLKISWRLFEPSVLCSETDTCLDALGKKEGGRG